METFPILLPHKVIRFLWDHVGLTIDSGEHQAFWHHAKSVGEGWAQGATLDMIPLGFHGDGAQTWTRYKVEKVLTLSFNVPLFRPRSVRYSRFVLFTIDKTKLFKNRTLNAVLRKLVTSFNALYMGVDPETGGPITRGSHRFYLCELRGDWEWVRDLWNFKKCGWNSKDVCFRCTASSVGGDASNHFSNSGSGVQGDCSWLRNQFDTHEFIAKRLPNKHL